MKYELKLIDDTIGKAKLLSVYRKSLTTVSKIKTKNLRVGLSVDMRNGAETVRFTIFEEKGNNRTFSVYDWQKADVVESIVYKAINLIKADDFERVVEASGY